MSKDAGSNPVFKRWVLYVAQDVEDPAVFCKGSRKSVALAEPIKEDVLVQSIDALLEKGVDLPAWLTGSPTLVDTNTHMAYVGSKALLQLETIKTGETEATPTSLNEMEGVAAHGGRVEFAQDDAFESQAVAGAESIVNDGKVTEEELQRYMTKRNQAQRQGPPLA